MHPPRPVRVAGLLIMLGLLPAGIGAVRATGVAALAHQAPQQPVFKGRIDLVRTDVTVIDNRTGKAVTDLTEPDFTVSENGVRQTIASFRAKADTVPADSGGGSAQAAAPAPDRRVFLIVFGAGRLEGPVDPFDGVIAFLRGRLRPGDLVSVMAYNRATAFTTDHEQVAQLVERLKLRRDGLRLALAEDAATNAFRNVDLSPDSQAAIDALFQTPGRDDILRNVTTMLLGSAVLRQNERAWWPWNRMLLTRDLLKTYAGIEYLRRVEGEKHLVLLTLWGFAPPFTLANDAVGMRLDSAEDDKRLAARANDANVALDIIHTAGTSGALRFSIMSSQNVAGHTGGQATSLRTAEAQLARIDDATRSGYILGYVPANPALDGKYRNVTVSVNRRDVTVVYRRGYTARAEPPPIDVREIVTRERLRDAATTDLAQDDITVRASATLAGGAARQVRVDLTIDPSRLTLTEAGGRHHGVIDLLILCGNTRQEVIGTVSQQMTLDMDEAHYQQALAGGIPYTATVPVTGVVNRVKVLVYDFPSDRLGAANVTVK